MNCQVIPIWNNLGLKYMVIIHYIKVYIDIIKTIRDPEEPGTLEELKMVNEDFVEVRSKYLAFMSQFSGPD